MVRALALAALAAAPVLVLGQGTSAPDAARQGEASPAGVQAVRALLEEVDASWATRDAPGAMDAMGKTLEGAAKESPGDYEVLWRLSRHYFWLSDDPNLEKKEKSRLGKIGWGWGDRATAANPARVEGWHYAAAGMGNYALGIGVFTALRQGIEGKFKERLSRAEAIDPGFDSGAVQTAWGRFWYELPWPKYDERKSRRALEDALRRNPANVRARVYLADLHAKEGRPEKARAELEKAVAEPPGRYDRAEERRWQAVARRKLSEPREERGDERPGG